MPVIGIMKKYIRTEQRKTLFVRKTKKYVNLGCAEQIVCIWYLACCCWSFGKLVVRDSGYFKTFFATKSLFFHHAPAVCKHVWVYPPLFLSIMCQPLQRLRVVILYLSARFAPFSFSLRGACGPGRRQMTLYLRSYRSPAQITTRPEEDRISRFVLFIISCSRTSVVILDIFV